MKQYFISQIKSQYPSELDKVLIGEAERFEHCTILYTQISDLIDYFKKVQEDFVKSHPGYKKIRIKFVENKNMLGITYIKMSSIQIPLIEIKDIPEDFTEFQIENILKLCKSSGL